MTDISPQNAWACTSLLMLLLCSLCTHFYGSNLSAILFGNPVGFNLFILNVSNDTHDEDKQNCTSRSRHQPPRANVKKRDGWLSGTVVSDTAWVGFFPLRCNYCARAICFYVNTQGQWLVSPFADCWKMIMRPLLRWSWRLSLNSSDVGYIFLYLSLSVQLSLFLFCSPLCFRPYLSFPISIYVISLYLSLPLSLSLLHSFVALQHFVNTQYHWLFISLTLSLSLSSSLSLFMFPSPSFSLCSDNASVLRHRTVF